MAIKRYPGLIHMMTTPDGIALADAETRMVVLATDYDRVLSLLRRAAERLELLHEGECEWEPLGKTVPEKACTCGLTELLSAIKELEGT